MHLADDAKSYGQLKCYYLLSLNDGIWFDKYMDKLWRFSSMENHNQLIIEKNVRQCIMTNAYFDMTKNSSITEYLNNLQRFVDNSRSNFVSNFFFSHFVCFTRFDERCYSLLCFLCANGINIWMYSFFFKHSFVTQVYNLFLSVFYKIYVIFSP